MTVSLVIGEARWEGWTSVDVQRSLEDASAQFRVGLTERWPGQEERRPIRVGAACRLAFDDDPVIVGHVDVAQIAYNDAIHEIFIAGRDATADLVDCSATIMSWKNATLEQIATAIAFPFNIRVEGGGAGAAAKPFETFSTEPGETCHEAIARAARLRGVLPFGDGLGTLMLVSPGRERASVTLEVGRNVLDIRGVVDYSERYATYSVLGQQGGGSNWATAEESAQVDATVEDPAVGRKRPWVQLGDQGLDGVDARARAEWEKSVRIGRSIRIDATLQGWRERPEGALWAPGRTVEVEDAWLGLDGRELLISTVRWTLDEAGTRTRLSLVPLDAFQPEPKPDPKASTGWIP